jgi:hypothetical protein
MVAPSFIITSISLYLIVIAVLHHAKTTKDAGLVFHLGEGLAVITAEALATLIATHLTRYLPSAGQPMRVQIRSRTITWGLVATARIGVLGIIIASPPIVNSVFTNAQHRMGSWCGVVVALRTVQTAYTLLMGVVDQLYSSQY